MAEDSVKHKSKLSLLPADNSAPWNESYKGTMTESPSPLDHKSSLEKKKASLLREPESNSSANIAHRGRSSATPPLATPGISYNSRNISVRSSLPEAKSIQTYQNLDIPESQPLSAKKSQPSGTARMLHTPNFNLEETSRENSGYQKVSIPEKALGKGSANLSPTTQGKRRRKKFILLAIVFILIIGTVVAIVIYIREKRKSLTSNGPIIIKSGEKLWGVGGDTITTEKGKKFIYNNNLGGTWVSIPYNDTARPQADQPALNERWDYSRNRILGVNLGGWLVLEPFITPALFEPFVQTAAPAVDEWTLSQKLGDSLSKTLEKHYDTFITEEDFAEIASAGLNWVRIPVGYWMIETKKGEPFLAGLSWKYLFKALIWARKYGLRVNLDLHAVPGSQNGYNHSGKQGTVGFLNGVMGIANAERTLNYIRTLTQFISQPEFKNVVPMFSVLNEPSNDYISHEITSSWYYEVYKKMRDISGVGEGNGPFMVIHDRFIGIDGGKNLRNVWTGFLSGSDRIGLDAHPYVCFGPQMTDNLLKNPLGVCNRWGARVSQTMEGFGLSISAEWSLALNDCGLYVNNIGWGSRFEGTWPNSTSPDPQFPAVGKCDTWLDHRLWTEEMKENFADVAQAYQDTMIHSFFWTWKIGNSTNQDHTPNPMWNYQLGLSAGYIRKDARRSSGKCPELALQQKQPLTTYPWVGTLSQWQTGGPGAGNIPQAQLDSVGTFPPATILGGAQGVLTASLLPRMTATGEVLSLKPTPIVQNDKIYGGGSGWFNDADNEGYLVPIDGCPYLDPWSGVGAAAPTPCISPAVPAQVKPTQAP
ncbi:glycoside hydrolase superfamily [Phakopsora pachyrhizi]|uniref:glucan 1,3-beta-glucosidase n=1 Tax=Phakopsora pachyrhizi TaxID=170000 RepID=A0AAV0BIA8_PHAPC|nr:glycoside hydrolase superfamily [Phakopsora pachyrhizi]